MQFEKLSEQEFNEYVKQFDNTGRNIEIGNALLEELNRVEEEVTKCASQVVKIRKMFLQKEISAAYDLCIRLSRKMSKLSTRIAMIPANYGIKEKNDYIANMVVPKKDVQFQYNDGVVVIQLPELLPHKPQLDVSTGKIRYYYDMDVWRASYYQAFLREFEFGKYKMPSGKVQISFLHHVTGKNPPDIDNLEIKVIVDIITNFLLVDDSYKYVCYFMDMIEDDSEFTEIYISCR